ncbi:MAG TPA: hypothetical protein VKZ50_06605 [bacterium]|nr:hypothetical protein [bacterium]
MMKSTLALVALVAIATVAPLSATAQPPQAADAPTHSVRGVIATIQAVNCASSDPTSCKTVLVVTAGPTAAPTLPDGRVTPTVSPVTVIVMPETPMVWTRTRRTLTLNQIQPGDAVHIQYQMIQGENIATRVDVTLQ